MFFKQKIDASSVDHVVTWFTGLRHTLRVCSNFCFFFVLKSHLSINTFAPLSLLFFFAFSRQIFHAYMAHDPSRVSALSTTATTTGPV
jgi:hypothetical protein